MESNAVKNCHHCGEEMHKPKGTAPYRWAERKYCSNSCMSSGLAKNSLQPVRDRLMNSVSINSESGCWVWNKSKSIFGYGKIMVCRVAQYAHRVSYKEFIGPITDDLLVLHKCDNPSCINPDHLFLGTQSENMRDMANKSRGADVKGPKNPQSKLTSEEVLAIRSSDAPSSALGRAYGVDKRTILNIRSKQTWRHL